VINISSPKVPPINIIIDKLKNSNKPLTPDKQQQLGLWLEKFINYHDSRLIDEAFIKLINE